MTGKKLLSIANISRELNIPESTLHYWKNRFAEYLPSIGRGRQRRYRIETVEIFKTISELLKLGHTTRDVKAQLAELYPLNIEPGPSASQPQSGQVVLQTAQTQEMQLQTAVAVGTEIAKVLGDRLSQVLSSFCPGLPPETMERMQEGMRMLEEQAEDVHSLREENTRLRDELQSMRDELNTLRENQDMLSGNGSGEAPKDDALKDDAMKDKLSVLEAELVRLRKDRREMEKFLLDKISASKNS
ncbi:MAG: MerR family transcriptional regulator [Desulfovibrio sp.]|uniref:MerR family transcriptional regulator n=1 Tax=Desulfovibrio sp. 7SRBS1 TaxID=3378064 RepID=UPI003B4204D1